MQAIGPPHKHKHSIGLPHKHKSLHAPASQAQDLQALVSQAQDLQAIGLPHKYKPSIGLPHKNKTSQVLVSQAQAFCHKHKHFVTSTRALQALVHKYKTLQALVPQAQDLASSCVASTHKHVSLYKHPVAYDGLVQDMICLWPYPIFQMHITRSGSYPGKSAQNG